MRKRIIVLSDGTGNAAAKVWRTNVWRTFESLELSSSAQIAVYDDGVGTSSFKPMAWLGGAFGVGLKRNVLGLYKFLCRNYKSADEYAEIAAKTTPRAAAPAGGYIADEIFLFGFSRGAFTVRVLAGLVLTQGLVTFDSEAELDRKARAAYRAYAPARHGGRTAVRSSHRMVTPARSARPRRSITPLSNRSSQPPSLFPGNGMRGPEKTQRKMAQGRYRPSPETKRSRERPPTRRHSPRSRKSPG
jgi:hypothetical protein